MGTFIFAILLIGASIGIFFFGSIFKVSKIFSKVGGSGAFVLGFIILMASMIVIIDAGETGVVVIFGQAQKNALSSGINLVPPYANVYKYSIRIHENTQAEANMIEARVNNGLIVLVDCTTFYLVNKAKAVEIYQNYATTTDELVDKFLKPTLRTVIRNVISKYSSEEAYSSKREQVGLEVETNLRDSIASKGIIIDKFLIRGIKLPEEVDKSIQLKISAQQEAEAMQYKKQKAQQEAEIKVIEAQGLANAQRIVSSTLTVSYLQHEAIQAYKDLAESKNTTFVILPTSATSTGMPLILNATK